MPLRIPLSFSDEEKSSSSLLPLSAPSSPGRAARRLSYKLRSRFGQYTVPIILGSIFLTLFYIVSHSRGGSAPLPPSVPAVGKLRHQERGQRGSLGLTKAKTPPVVAEIPSRDDNGVHFLVQEEEELIAEDDLFWEQYTEEKALSAAEKAAEAELQAHREDVIEQNRMGSLRALVWWLAEGGLFPDDWEIPTKSYLKKVGARGMERMLEDIEPGEEDELIFEEGWAEFAKKRYRLVVLSKSYCPYSTKAKSILSKYHITPAPFVIELDQRPDTNIIQTLLHHLTGRRTVPNVLFDFVSVGGSDDLTLIHAEGGLQRRLEDMGVLPGSWRRQPAVPAAPARAIPAPLPEVEKAVPVEKKPVVEKEPYVDMQAGGGGQKVLQAPKVQVKKEEEDEVVDPSDFGYDQEELEEEQESEVSESDQLDSEVEDENEGEEEESNVTEEEEEEEEGPIVPIKAAALLADKHVLPKQPAVHNADKEEEEEDDDDQPIIAAGATPEEIRAAIQAAHGDSYLFESDDEEAPGDEDYVGDILPMDGFESEPELEMDDSEPLEDVEEAEPVEQHIPVVPKMPKAAEVLPPQPPQRAAAPVVPAPPIAAKQAAPVQEEPFKVFGNALAQPPAKAKAAAKGVKAVKAEAPPIQKGAAGVPPKKKAAKPANPVGVIPANPIAAPPVKPVQPVQPVQQPVVPAKPVVPVAPVAPIAPVVPAVPAVADTPVVPAKPLSEEEQLLLNRKAKPKSPAMVPGGAVAPLINDNSPNPNARIAQDPALLKKQDPIAPKAQPVAQLPPNGRQQQPAGPIGAEAVDARKADAKKAALERKQAAGQARQKPKQQIQPKQRKPAVLAPKKKAGAVVGAGKEVRRKEAARMGKQDQRKQKGRILA